MILRLARGGNAVVTGPAATQYLRVIDLPDTCPARLAVTVLALDGGTDVVGRWRRGLYQASAVVARAAFAGRPLEDALDVADFAIDILMGPLEGPGGREMIKIGTEGRLSARRSQPQSEEFQHRGE